MTTTNEDEFAPVLSGAGDSDYERYLRTDELLALQKGPDEWVHRDELLFQTVHQSSELWLKHAWIEVEEATRLVGERDVAAALRLLRRANESLHYVVGFLEHLELMSPWEYQDVRPGFARSGARRRRSSTRSMRCGVSADCRSSRSTRAVASTKTSISLRKH
jgi:Tryptophan 2,3-dioxygenase